MGQEEGKAIMDPEETGVAVADEAPEMEMESAGIGTDVGQEQDAPERHEAAATQAQQPNVWGAFKKIPEFATADDRTIAGKLYASYEREKAASAQLASLRQIMPYAQEFMTHRPAFMEWQKSRSAESAQPQGQQGVPGVRQPQGQQKQSWWNPPQVTEFNKRFLVKDEHGRDTIHPEAPYEAQQELYNFLNYKADFAKRFLEDPEKALGPMLEARAAEIANQAIESRFSQQETESFVDSVMEENRDWMVDENGDATPAGFIMHAYINKAREYGIADPKQRWEFAVSMLERDALLEQRQGGAGGAQVQPQNAVAAIPAAAPQSEPVPTEEPTERAQSVAERNMGFHRREATRRPSRTSGLGAADSRAPKPRMAFNDMLAEAMSSRGR